MKADKFCPRLDGIGSACGVFLKARKLTSWVDGIVILSVVLMKAWILCPQVDRQRRGTENRFATAASSAVCEN